MNVILTAPLWLQVPLVMAIAVPLALVAAVALVRLIDALFLATERTWQATAGPDRTDD